MTGDRYSFLDLVCFAMQRHSAAAQVQVDTVVAGMMMMMMMMMLMYDVNYFA